MDMAQLEYGLHYLSNIKISKLTSSPHINFIDRRVPIPQRLHRLLQRIFLKGSDIQHQTGHLMRLGVFVLVVFPPRRGQTQVFLRSQLRNLNGSLTPQVTPEAFERRTAALSAGALM